MMTIRFIRRQHATWGALVPWLAVTALIACAVAIALYGCASTQLPAPCDAPTLASGTAQCHALVRAKCSRSDAGVVDPACPELAACDRWVDQWLACHDGGAPVPGAAGARD